MELLTGERMHTDEGTPAAPAASAAQSLETTADTASSAGTVTASVAGRTEDLDLGDYIFEKVGWDKKERVSGLNLSLVLYDPGRMPLLLAQILGAMPRIRAALNELNFVHFARFLPTHNHTALQVVTEFDGDFDTYVMDFAIVLEQEFSLMLSYVKKDDLWRPGWRVRDHPREFLDYVKRHNRVKVAPSIPLPDYPLYAAYETSVVDLVGPRRTLPSPALDRAPAEVPLADVQGNIVRGYRARHGVHFLLHIQDEGRVRRFIAGLLGEGDAPAGLQLTSAAPWGEGAPKVLANLGVTYPGLQALGLPDAVLEALPESYRMGAAERAVTNGDIGSNAVGHWRIGRKQDADHVLDSDCIHLMLSLYTKQEAAEDLLAQANQLRAQLGQSGLRAVAEEVTEMPVSQQDHFGFREGIANPRLAITERPLPANDRQPAASVGEFLLGADYQDIYGGPSLRDLPAALMTNGSFCALRIAQQHEENFDALLAGAARASGLPRDLLAAKFMGRWRDGVPVSRRWLASQPAGAAGNDFDYAPSYEYPDEHEDHAGQRCPVGAHIRRANPRGSRIAGARYTRRLIRRGMPYRRVADGKTEVGLFGLFFCGDLERQYEFILREWLNGDRFAHGLSGTRDVFAGAHESGAKFLLPVEGRHEPLELEVKEPLTTVRGSLYLFYPGLAALRLLTLEPVALQPLSVVGAIGAAFDWLPEKTKREIVDAIVPAPGTEGRPTPAVPGSPLDPATFDPTAPRFIADPYPDFTTFRRDYPVCYVPRHRAYWVFSHALVRQLYTNPYILKGNPNGNLPRGILSMEAMEHAPVRAALKPQFVQLFAQYGAVYARSEADVAIAQLGAGPFDLVEDFARPVARNVFYRLLGRVDDQERAKLDRAARDLMRFSDRTGGAAQLLAVGAGLELAGRLAALAARSLLGPPSMARAVARMVPSQLGPAQAVMSLLQITLAGYLSTEFLLCTTVRNLLKHAPNDWRTLHGLSDPALADLLDEMRRYDAPLGAIERYAGDDRTDSRNHGITLGGVRVPKGCLIMGMLGSANRDDAVFGQDAGQLMVGRFAGRPDGSTARHLALGEGARDCIGTPLQHLTVPAALRALSRARPDLQLVSPQAEPPWIPNIYFRSFERLLVQ